MSDHTSHTEIKVGSNRSFGLVIGGVFLIIAVFPVLFGGELRLWALAVSAVFAGLGLARPAVLQPLNIAWFRFGMLLNRIISPIVMGIIFFVTVTPIALVRRLRAGDPLSQRFDPEADSYWIVRSAEDRPTDMKKQF